MPSISSLWVELALQADNFNNGLRDAQREAKEFEKTIRPSITAAKELGETMSLVGDVMAVGMFEATKKAAEYGAELEHLHARSGVSVEDLAKLGFAADQNGSSLEGLGNGLKFLSKNMELASEGSSKQILAFTNLGISAKDFNETGGSSAKMFALLSDRISGLADPSQHNADLNAILGKSYADLTNTMLLGSEGQRKYGDEAERLGKVISEQAAKADLEFVQTEKEVKAALEGTANAIGEALLPQLTSMAATVRDSIVDVTKFAKEHEGLTKAAFDASVAIGAVGGGLLAIGFGAPVVLKAVDSLEGVFTALSAAAGEAGLAGVLMGPVGIGAAAVAAAGGLVYLLDKTDAGHEIISSIASDFESAAAEVSHFASDLGEISWAALTAVGHEMSDLATDVKELGDDLLGLAGISHNEGWDLLKERFSDSLGLKPLADLLKTVTSGMDSLLGKAAPRIDPLLAAASGMNAFKTSVDDQTKSILEEVLALDTYSLKLEQESPEWKKSADAIAAIQKKAREDESKANDEYYATVVEGYKNQRQLGLISAEDLKIDLIAAENDRYAATDLADGNLQALAMKHAGIIQKVIDEDAKYQHQSALAAQGQQNTDLQAAQADRNKADTEMIDAMLVIYNKKWQLGAESADALHDQQIEAENQKWGMLVASGKNSEALETQHQINLGNIDAEYAKNVLVIDQGLADEQKFFRDNDTKEHQATIDDQHARAVIASKDDIKLLHEQEKEREQIGKDIEAAWDRSMNGLASSTSSAFAKMVIDGQFNMDALVNIAKNTAESMLSALIKGMLTPFTSELAKLGTSLTDSILGISQTVDAAGKSTGGIANGKGLLGAIGGLFGKNITGSSTESGGILGNIGGSGGSGGGLLSSLFGSLGSAGGKSSIDEYGNLVTSGGTAGSGLLGLFGGGSGLSSAIGLSGGITGIGSAAGTTSLLGIGGSTSVFSSLTPFLTNPITAAVAGGIIATISLIKSQAHWEANDLVQHIQEPFDKSRGELFDAETVAADNGTLTQGLVLTTQQGMHELWNAAQQQVETWRTAKGSSKDRDEVAANFHRTEDSFMAGILKYVDDKAHFHYWDTAYRDGTVNDAAAAGLPHYATGTPFLWQDGPIFAHRGEAVIPAAQNPWNPSNGGGQSQEPQQPVNYNFYLAAGATLDESYAVTHLIPMLQRWMKQDTRGFKTSITRGVKDTWDSVVTP